MVATKIENNNTDGTEKTYCVRVTADGEVIGYVSENCVLYDDYINLKVIDGPKIIGVVNKDFVFTKKQALKVKKQYCKEFDFLIEYHDLRVRIIEVKN